MESQDRRLKRFNILLDDQSLLYFPGSFLTGKVLLELSADLPASSLTFHIIGEGIVKLTSKHNKLLASDRESYIDFKMPLLGNSSTSDGNSIGNSTGASLNPSDSLSDNHDTGHEATSLDGDGDDDSYVDLSSMNSATSNGKHSKKKKKVMILSAGVHTFPFKLGLPLGLPSTFLGIHGWVQYFCRASLIEARSGVLHKNEQVFIIINPIDLNAEPSILQQPFYCEAEEKLRSSRLGLQLNLSARNRSSTAISSSKSASLTKQTNYTGLVKCRLRLDRGGFVPGESICVSASIKNESKFVIKKTRLVLGETVQYAAHGRLVEAETRELAAIEKGRIEPLTDDSHMWKREMLPIPALPPTNIRGCNLIKIQYDVYFLIHAKGVKKPIKLQLPILMATYPIRNSDGTLRRRKGALYPNSLPVFRHWLEVDSSEK